MYQEEFERFRYSNGFVSILFPCHLIYSTCSSQSAKRAVQQQEYQDSEETYKPRWCRLRHFPNFIITLYQAFYPRDRELGLDYYPLCFARSRLIAFKVQFVPLAAFWART